MGHITYCLMCLGTEMKMYPMNTTMIRIYNELISYSKKRNFTERYACYECGYLLLKYDNFKRKCHRAYNIIYSLSPNSLQIPEDLLNSIDRKQNKLTTSMCSWTMSYNYEPKEQEFESDEEVKADLITSDNDEINNEDDPLEAMEEQAVYLDVKNSSETDEDEQRSLYCKSEPDCTDDHEPDSNLDYKPDSNLDYKPDSNLDCKLLDDKNKIEHDIEDDYQFTQTFKVESSDYKPNSGSMLWLTIESKENTELFDNEPHTGSTIQSFDNNNAMVLPYLVIDKRDTLGKKFNNEKKAVSKKINKKKEKVNKANGKHIIVLKPLQKRKIIHHEFRRKSLPDDIIKEHMTVIELTPEEVKEEFLLRKKSSNYTNNPFKCNLCYKGFISNNSYQTHMKKHSLKYGEFQCDICKLCYVTRARVKKHVVVHKRKYSCNKCPYICFNQSQFYGHIMSHTDKKYQCDKCEMSYRFQNSLLTHMHIKHGGEDVCDFCGSTFASEKGLALHKLILHRQEENERLGPRCDECDVHFASELAWKRHRVLCSRHQVQFGCRVCGEEFPNAEILRSHVREHEPEKKRKYLTKRCRFCKRALPNKEALRKHLEKKHPNEYAKCKLSESEAGRYICEICGKACKKTSSLIMHQRTHTNEMPYVCPECGLRYKYKNQLKRHLRAHGEEPVFHCDLCGRQFAQKKGLERHMRLHLNIRPYKCVACDKSFLYRSDERTHYRHVHEKVPYPKKNVCPEEKRRKPFPRSRVQIFNL